MEKPVCIAGAQPGVGSEMASNLDSLERSQLSYCTALEGEAGISSLESYWRTLYVECAAQTPFASWEWVSSWWHHFSSADPNQPLTLYPIAIYDSTKTLIGLAPFYATVFSGGALQRRALRLVGDLGSVPALSEELPLLLRRGRESEALQSLLAFLVGPARNRWDTLHLCVPVVAEEESTGTDDSNLSGSSALNTSTTLNAEWLRLPADWETLRRSLSKSTRDNLAYYPRLLNRHNRSWTIRRVTDDGRMRTASDLLVDLHRRRARCTVCLPHLDHLPTQSHQECMSEALTRLAEIGMASIWVMEIDGQSAAAQAVFEDENNICIYYSGFEPSFRAYSPLTILHSEIIKAAIREGKSGVNFLGGKFYYKSRWGARSIPRFRQIRKVRPSPISLIRTLLDFASRK